MSLQVLVVLLLREVLVDEEVLSLQVLVVLLLREVLVDDEMLLSLQVLVVLLLWEVLVNDEVFLSIKEKLIAISLLVTAIFTFALVNIFRLLLNKSSCPTPILHLFVGNLTTTFVLHKSHEGTLLCF